MVDDNKFRNALYALQEILIKGRTMAHEKEDHKKIAKLLDAAEYLPYLIGNSKQANSEFRTHLECIAKEFKDSQILKKFDQNDVPDSWYEE